MASLTTAKHMGKRAYFAHQIHHNEIYLIQHCHLPPTEGGAYCGPETLLDKQTVLHNVQQYLAMQNLGTIMPLRLHKHVNDVIFPALDLSGKNASICNWMAINWWALPAKM